MVKENSLTQPEAVREVVANQLSDGTGITLTRDDAANLLTIAATLSPFDTDNLSEGTGNLYFTAARAKSAAVDNTAYGSDWDDVTDVAPSKNAVYDTLSSHYANSSAHHVKTGDDEVYGLIRYQSSPPTTGDEVVFVDSDNDMLKVYDSGTGSWVTVGGSSDVSQLSDLSDVGSIDYTAGNVLRADGTDFDAAVLQHSDLDGVGSSDHHTKYALTDDLTADEITQLQNINTNAISNAQWGYLGGLNQALDTSQTPTFADLTLADWQLSSPSYKTLHDLLTTCLSSGYITYDGTTDNGDGTIDVGAGTGIIRTTDSATGTAKFFDWSAATGLSLTDQSTNYIYIDYNAGSPSVNITTDYKTITLTTQFIVGRVFRNGTDLTIIDAGMELPNLQAEHLRRAYELNEVRRAEGIETSEAGTRNIAVSAGIAYTREERTTTSDYDTSVSDTFTRWYRDGAGGWTTETGETQIDNTRYDDNSGTPPDVRNNNYVNRFVYVTFNDGLHIQLGQVDHNKLSDALEETVPTPPPLLRDFSILSARITIEKNASSFSELQSAFTETFSGSVVQDHNDLGTIQGGVAGERYHLTQTEHNSLSGIDSAPVESDKFTTDGGFLVGTGAGTYQEETGSIARASLGLKRWKSWMGGM